ncbi:ABC transporter permease [Puia sp.]|jgi:ABC-type antimicrobial peptide transport system permease subunit|uniref:ABC transporter permease n=1 Tax=Puia sp. TaxID=2045100 RepID=UPI002F42ACA0
MFRNYFVIAWRNILKSKWYSLINTLGLSIGMAVALLIGLWIWDEVSFDHYYPNHSQIAQVMTTQTFNGNTGTGQAVSLPVAPELRTKYGADLPKVSRTSWNFQHILAVNDKKITENGMFVEPDFAQIVPLRMQRGTAKALADPSSILVCQTLARTLFGTEDVVGKTVRMDNKVEMRVAGVFQDPPRNSSFYDTKCLISWAQYVAQNDWIKRNESHWGNHSWQTFVLIAPNTTADKVTAKIKDIAKPHNKDGDEHLVLQPMDNFHLYSDFTNGKVTGGRIKFVWLFGIIGAFVLLLACINFMNLSTARSEKRAKEVGIRKTVGSLRGQLIGQFLCESVVVALLALVFALVWVLISLPFFNTLADKDMHLPWAQPLFWLMVVGFTLFTGLVAGSYPAFYLSGFEPIRVLKGTFRVGKYASLPRQVLVVVQFTVSVALIIGTILVFEQINYARSRPVGYSREGLISINMTTPEIYGHYDVMRADLLRTGAVVDMSESSSPVTSIYSNQIGFSWKGKDPTTTPLFGIVACTHDFGRTMGWKIREGRDYSRQFVTDSGATVAAGIAGHPDSVVKYGGALILNEAAVKLTGLKHVVGEIFQWNDQPHTVIGVVKDMVMESPYQPIKPTIFFLDYGWTQVITVRLSPTMTTKSALAAIEPIFKRYNPGSSFEYQFVDEEYAKKFDDEKRIGSLATVFAILAVFISCLGLFGLASFVAEQRTKEIGVRKVLGASLFHVWRMLSKDFVMLVVISCFIAIPISWYFLHQWLQQYEYRAPISWWVFALSGVGALVITLLTVSWQAIRAGLLNPVKSLRTE